MRLWVDIENPPQVQYLLPVAHAVASLDAEVIVTARDYGVTFALLDDRGEPHRRVGAAYGASKGAKVSGLARRVRELVHAVRAERPDVLVCASRAAVMAARVLRIPSYVILDYEFVDARVFRFAGSTILHPEVIPADAFQRQRIPADRLVAFRGVKEGLRLPRRT